MNLDEQSDLFHAFEWLRGEALKNNSHAELLMRRIIEIEKKNNPKLTLGQAMDMDRKGPYGPLDA